MSHERTPRICMVAPLYHLSMGGLGRQAQLLSEKLADSGAPLFVITRKMKGSETGIYSENVRVVRIATPWPGVPILEEVGLKSLIISLIFSLGAARALFRERKNYDIVHFHGARAALFFNIPLLLLLRKKTVAKVSAANHPFEVGSLSGKHGVPGRLLVRLARKVDRYVAISGEIERGLLKDGIEEGRIIRIPNFVDVGDGAPREPGAPSLREVHGLGEKTVVVFSGRLVPRKGVETLLRAWECVTKKHDNGVLLILGDGPLRPDLEERAGRLRISSSVLFAGWQRDVRGFLAEADIFVQPSLQEGMSNALLEAMAAGLPVVATRIGGTEDILKHGINGLIVGPGDVEALSESLCFLIEHGEKAAALGLKALETVRADYGREKVALRYRGLYRELAGGSP